MGGDPRHLRGHWGEDLACEELTRRGYAILARRFRTRRGEIDVVARVGTTIVFVEVKTRGSNAFGGGAAAVTAGKQRRLVRVATEYLAMSRQLDVACRFDVVVVSVAAGAQVEVYADAFRA